MQALGLIESISFVNLLCPGLYKTYVRPHLEYCTPVWNPFLARDIDQLEKVQHDATRLFRAWRAYLMRKGYNSFTHALYSATGNVQT